MEGTEIWRMRLISLLAVFYGIAGAAHLAIPKPFLAITPGWVAYPRAVIILTGICELAGAIGLLVPRLRRMVGIGLALYAICVFPANIKHAIDSLSGATPSIWQWLYHLVRLPLQPAIVWAALLAAGRVAWPFAKCKDKREP